MIVARPEEGIVSPPRQESIEELFSALESPLLSYALKILREREPSEDVVQEAFMKLHAQFVEVREPRKWLYRTVHNLALNHLRQGNKIVPLRPVMEEGSGAGSESIDPEPLPDEQIVRLEGIGMVRLSLEALDERSREVVRLKFNEDLSYKQISDRTGLTISHVGYLLHHALKAVAAELAKTGLTK
ncbi:MAG: polymerase, sigma-24 subunit, subfamily [Verrucomicrobiales bacterium]|nr:polymerase, sigma-24 subunit, subfamily [Verrucomicrobiales bacterium]